MKEKLNRLGLVASVMLVLITTQLMTPVMAGSYIKSVQIGVDRRNVVKGESVEVTVIVFYDTNEVSEILIYLKEDDIIGDDIIDYVRLISPCDRAFFKFTPSNWAGGVEGKTIEVYAEALAFDAFGNRIDKCLSRKIFIHVRP